MRKLRLDIFRFPVGFDSSQTNRVDFVEVLTNVGYVMHVYQIQKSIGKGKKMTGGETFILEMYELLAKQILLGWQTRVWWGSIEATATSYRRPYQNVLPIQFV